MDANPTYLRSAAVAKRLRCSTFKVRSLIHEGRFPHARKIDPAKRNSPWLIPLDDVIAYEKEISSLSPFDGNGWGIFSRRAWKRWIRRNW